MIDRQRIITIDGPSGSGKSSLCQLLARKLGWSLLDSGALYRVVGLLALERGASLDDEATIADLATGIDVSFRVTNPYEPARVLLSGRDISDDIRTEACSNVASKIAIYPALRNALKVLQRRFAPSLTSSGGLVADGRDMGTVIFPDAGLKIYLSASAKARAERRYKQLLAQGQCVNIARILKAIEARDARDRNRTIAPLKAAPDALLIDNSAMTIEQVLAPILAECERRRWR